MSFDLVCQNCGAPSGPSTGECPYCKSVMTHKKVKDSPTVTNIRKFYNAGDLEKALLLFRSSYKKPGKTIEDPAFLMLGVKILLESEGPESQIRSLLSQVLRHSSYTEEADLYLEILEAKRLLSHDANDPGEKKFKKLLRRSPRNPHILFLLGSHLYWVEGMTTKAVVLLEKCVKERPAFLRAWGCLGAIYEKLGDKTSALRSYRKAQALEKNRKMKEFFKTRISSIA